MRHYRIFITAIVLPLQLCGHLWALPTTAHDAEMAVEGWLKADSQPLNTALGRNIAKVETFTNDEGEPVYHIVYLHPSGFVIVAADDQVEPIVGFCDNGSYDPAPEYPLGTLVTGDLNGRIAAVRRAFSPLATTPQSDETKVRKKWESLVGLATASEGGVKLMGVSPIIDGGPPDLRVAPLLTSQWGQTCCEGPDGRPRACYNYYTSHIIHSIQVTGVGSPEWASVRKPPQKGAFSFREEYPAIANYASVIQVPVEFLFENRKQTRGEWSEVPVYISFVSQDDLSNGKEHEWTRILDARFLLRLRGPSCLRGERILVPWQ